jgi:hypothetical protein
MTDHDPELDCVLSFPLWVTSFESSNKKPISQAQGKKPAFKKEILTSQNFLTKGN